MNLYVYCNNNPVLLVDPTGKAAFWYHFYDGFRAGNGLWDSLKLGWATMMPDFNGLANTSWAHATTDNRDISPQQAIDDSLAHAASAWNSGTGTIEDQGLAIHIWRDVASHEGSYFPDPASAGDYTAHIIQYDLVPGGSFSNVIGSRMNNPKP